MRAPVRRPLRARPPDAHTLASSRHIKLEDLADADWLFPRATGGVATTYDRLMRAAWAAAGFQPRILFEVNDCQTVQGFVAAGLGIAVLPELAIHPIPPDVVVRPLESAPYRRILAASLARSKGTPACQAGLQHLEVSLARSRAHREVAGGRW